MWKHEIIDSLRFLKARAKKEMLDICNNVSDVISSAVEFHLGDVEDHMGGVSKQCKEKNIDFFSAPDGSALPYPKTLLTFYKDDVSGKKRKFAILLCEQGSNVAALVLCFDTEFFLWIPPFAGAVVDHGECSVVALIPCKDGDRDVADSAQTTNACMWIALYFLRLIHAKNIFNQPHSPSAAMNRKRARRGDAVAEKYYTLVFSAPGAVVKKDQETGEYLHGVRPFHICRGHIQHVEESRPLFGRKGCFGDFWIPAHARGDRKNGVVMKDYRVLADV